MIIAALVSDENEEMKIQKISKFTRIEMWSAFEVSKLRDSRH